MDSPELFPQVILPLVLLDILADHGVYLALQTGNFKLVV